MPLDRYRSVLDIRDVNRTIPNLKISNRETDIFIAYNETDRLDLISSRIYGYPELYWIILEANDYSSEIEIEYGEILRVPFPLEGVMSEIKSQVGSR